MTAALWMALAAHAAKPLTPEAAATALIEGALASDLTWQRIVEFADDIGPRPGGSPAMEAAVEWGLAALTEDGLVNVRAEPVTIDAWERGEERAALTAPVAEPLPITTFGRSVGTPDGGIEAEVVVVDDFAHLDALGEAVRGKIVLYDVPFTTYGELFDYRWSGASRAAAHGAVAALLRSVGPVGSATLHTGSMRYDEAQPRIPTAAVTAEDAMRLRRYAERGLPVRVRLEMGARQVGERPSANVVGEIAGKGKAKDEIVVLACHLDSWDLGRGAQDDAAGCAMVMEAARLIATLPVPPARTVRVVLYTNEENGVTGGFQYGTAHADEMPLHVAGIEADIGAGPIRGFAVDVRRGDELDADASAALAATLSPARDLLAPIVDASFTPGYGGTDLLPLAYAGVPTFGVDLDESGYWPIHHTVADTVDKIDPEVVRRNTAAIAVFTWWLVHHPPVVDSGSVGTPPEDR